MGLEWGSIADWVTGTITAAGLFLAYWQMNLQHKDEQENLEEMRQDYIKDHEPHPEIFLYVVRDEKNIGDGMYAVGEEYHLESNLFNIGGGSEIYKFSYIVGRFDFDRHSENLIELKNAILSKEIKFYIPQKNIIQEIIGPRALDYQSIGPMQSTTVLGIELEDLRLFSNELEKDQDSMVIIYEDILGNFIYKYFEFDGHEVTLHENTFIMSKTTKCE